MFKKTPALPLAKHYLFWILFFFVQRFIFVLYYLRLFKGLGSSVVAKSFFHGLQLDVSMAGYFAVLPLLLFIIQYITRADFFYRTYRVYSIVLLTAVILISGGDLGLYENWGVKLNFRALSMLAHPAEVMETVQSAPLWALCSIIVIEGIIAFFLFRKIFSRPVKKGEKKEYYSPFRFGLVAVLCTALVFISIRGGVQEIPVNESSVYFSSYSIANHTAVNTPWQLAKSIIKNRKSGNKNIYNYFDNGVAEAMVHKLYAPVQGDTTIRILDTLRPNIVFIQLESFTADVIQELGGDSGIAPNISRFIKEGLLFTNIFASGIRTDQGIIALLCGFPAQPQTNIANQSDKVEHLPFLSLSLKQAGYQNAFYYGGDLSFGRFNTIAHHAGFETIVGVDDFDDAEMFNKWGADDNSLFKKYISEKGNPAEPFFSYIITSSSHEPFSVPMPTVFKGDAVEQKFRNACYFVDRSVGAFIDAIKSRPWYRNTLFVLAADHGHTQPRGRAFDVPEKYHIPFVLFGEPLTRAYRCKTINSLGSQTDIAATLLHQLQLDASAFAWSNDLLSANRKQFAFYSFDDGFGWLNKKDTIIYDNRARQLLETSAIHTKAVEDSLVDNGKAYMQALYDAFLRY